jgi:hypothetical protein
VDQELRDKIGEEWLAEKCGLQKRKLYELLSQRWNKLFRATPEDLLSDLAEEPQTFNLGRIALAYLDLLRLDSIKAVVWRDESRPQFLESLGKAYDRVWHEHLSQMSQYYLLPVKIVRDKGLIDEEEKRESAEELVKLCLRCSGSRIWIREGPDQGSWGFNVKNSQVLVTALAAFWRHAFDEENKERFEAAFETVAEH